MNEEMKTEKQMEEQANAATAVLGGAVRRLMDDGVEPAALAEALAAALGVMLAAAPRHMADSVSAAMWTRMQQARRETWEAVDAAEPTH